MRTPERILSEIKQTAQELSELFEEFCESNNLQPIQDKLDELVNKQILKKWVIYPNNSVLNSDRFLVIKTQIIEALYYIEIIIWQSGVFKMYEVISLNAEREEIV